MLRNPAFRKQVLQRLFAQTPDLDALAMTKAFLRADHMNAAEETAHPFALGGRAELGPATAAPLEQRESKTFIFEQRARIAHQRRHDRNLGGGQLERKAMLFVNRRLTP